MRATLERPRLMLGKSAARQPVGVPLVTDLVGQLTKPQTVYTGPNDVGFNYGMLDNDKLGDCTWAGFVHLVQVVCLLLGVSAPSYADDTVGQAYLKWNNGVDAGDNELDVMVALFKPGGLLGIQVAGYATAGDGNSVTELLGIVQTFGAAYIGVQMPYVTQQQFADGEPWALTNTSADSDIEGGHCVVPLAFDQPRRLVQLLTWGRRQWATYDWLTANMDEQHALVPMQVRTAGVLDGVDWAQLDATLSTVGEHAG